MKIFAQRRPRPLTGPYRGAPPALNLNAGGLKPSKKRIIIQAMNKLPDNTAIEQWDTVITPKKSLFELNLKEVWQYRDLLFLFVRRDFVAMYKQTILGPLWYFIQPILTTLMFTVVFGRIAKIPTDGLALPCCFIWPVSPIGIIFPPA
jgi:hypothetical protein